MDSPDQFPELSFPPPSAPRKKFQDRTWLHVILFLFTIYTTTRVGTYHYASFVGDFRPVIIRGSWLPFAKYGLWYSATILLILGTHELGHYVACRYYQVDASLPFFLPVPTPLTGTLGAFIKIREPIRTKRMLFDIGAAGPFAGFIVAVPALVIGLSMSHVVKLPPHFAGYELGEPLLFKMASRAILGPIPAGYDVNLHPVAFAAWFGLFATALNLFPVGQLDGGHISYAVFGRRSSTITIGTICTSAVLTLVSPSWMTWTALMIVAMFVMGRHHPPTVDEHVPLDMGRRWLALAALVVFILCFMYAPIEPTKFLQQ